MDSEPEFECNASLLISCFPPVNVATNSDVLTRRAGHAIEARIVWHFGATTIARAADCIGVPAIVGTLRVKANECKSYCSNMS
jgi:hypothetical protein